MRRCSGLMLVVACAGCTTCPQADFMDFAFKSRNACCDPPVVAPAGFVAAPAPVAAVPAAPASKDHPWCRPFKKLCGKDDASP